MNYILKQILPPGSNSQPIEIHLTEDEVQVGRRSKMILAKFAQVSRDHATFYKTDGGTLFVKDLKSLNGIYVNDVKIGSSLRPLEVGDVIGFGVTSDQVDVGFVCVVNSDNLDSKVKHEVIDISDDDEPVEATKSKTNCILNSQSSRNGNPSPHTADSSKILACDDDSVCRKSNSVVNSTNPEVFSNKGTHSEFSNSKLSDNTTVTTVQCGNSSKSFLVPALDNVVSKNHPVKISKLPAASDSEIKNNVLHKNIPALDSPNHHIHNEINKMLQFSSASNSYEVVADRSSTVKCKTEITEDSENSVSHNVPVKQNMPYIQRIVKDSESTSKPCKNLLPHIISPKTNVVTHSEYIAVNNFQNISPMVLPNAVKIENKPVKKFSIKKCHVPLRKCDSESFEWPSNVKNPFLEEHKDSISKNVNVISQPLNKKTNLSAYKKNSTDFGNKTIKTESGIENDVNNAAGKSNTRKRKYSSNFNDETLTNKPSKKPCLPNEDSNFRSSENHIDIGNNINNTIEKSDAKKRIETCNFNDETLTSKSSTSKKSSLANEDNTFGNNFSIYKKSQSKNCSESDNDSDDGLNYSQVEDIIYISDDDEYYDFKSSQNYVKIKTEPEEIEDHHDDDDCFDNLGINECSTSSNRAGDFSLLKQANEDNTETLESIRAFVNDAVQKEVKQLDDDSRVTSTTNPENAFFPVLSQNFDSDEENNVDDSTISKTCKDKFPAYENMEDCSGDEYLPSVSTRSNAYRSDSITNKKGKESTKIKLIDAQPMQYRPRKLRGRDEGFVERTKSVSSSSSKKKKVDSPKKQLAKEKKSFNSNFKIPLKRSKVVKRSPEKMTNNQISKELPISKKPLEKKAPTVKTRPEKHTSRMGFLMNDVEINPRRPSKSVTDTKIIEKTNAVSNKHDQNLSPKQTNISVSSVKQNDIPIKQNSVSGSFVKPDNIPIKQKNVSSSSVMQNDLSSSFAKQSNLSSSSAKQGNLSSSSANQSNLSSSSAKQSNLSSSSAKQSNVFDSSIKQSKISVPNKNIEQKIAHTSVACNKSTLNRTAFNPRDPRQNRVPNPTSGLLRQDLSVPKTLPSTSEKTHKVISNHKSLEKPTVDLKSKLIKELLRLNTKWLEEQNKVKYPPQTVTSGAADLPLKYDSYDSYVSLFYPMLMLELWEQMYIESKEVYESKKQYKKFFFSVLSYTSKVDYIELKCESVVNEKVSFSPCEGSIAILEMKENSNRCNPMFGVIQKHKVDSLNFNSLKLPHWKRLPEEWITNAKHYTFYVHIKKKEMSFALASLMKGNGLCFIRNKLRLVDALHYLKNSPLLPDILQPTWKTFFVKYSAVSPTREFNSGQMEVIKCVTAEICKPFREPKIILLQGPPGTGKTHTIIGLIQKFLNIKNYNSNFKILVTAPSNAAIDEIGCRLIELSDKFSSKGAIKFVRVGLTEQIHVRMKPYSLDRKFKDWNVYMQKERELQILQAEIIRLKNESYNKDVSERLKYLQERYNHLSDDDPARRMDYYAEFTRKQNLLKDSHIVLSTLSSCGLSLLLKTFKLNSDFQFSFCIIDESTQCTELEILQPLMLGVRKLILVGDHKQLPATVLSKTACKYGLERSAFERFHMYFEMYCKKTPMFTLSEQFRMHSAICEFPSKFIYDHKLITNPNINVKYADFPLKPYMMLDIYVSQEKNDSSSKSNNCEAQVIINICTVLIDIVESVSSIGIITPYQAQRSLYVQALNINPRYKDIEVNTVDGFQGREKDIIIVSSVRANSQSGSIGFLACKRRLNVAITRAKKCLIICGHADSLINNHGWRELIMDAKERNVFFPVTCPEDIPFLLKHYMRKYKPGGSNYV